MSTEFREEAVRLSRTSGRPMAQVVRELGVMGLRARLRAAGILPSMGRKGDAYDNALCEAFFATLEREVLDRYRFRTREEARSVLFAYLEAFYNRRRRHSALGYLSPAEFERRWLRGHESLSPTLSTKAG